MNKVKKINKKIRVQIKILSPNNNKVNNNNRIPF